MCVESYYKTLTIDKSVAERLNFNPYYPVIESGLEDPLIMNGHPFINFASNNYLGIACDQRIKRAIIEGIEKYGASMCGTPIATGYVDAFERVEKRLAEFVGLEDATLFPSCYQANAGIFSVLVARADAIVVDHYAHSSLIGGVRTVGCRVLPFMHNSIESLEMILRQTTGFRQVFVVTESVFSTEGSIAPLDKIVQLCDEYGAIPVVDDSHGIGVIGKAGRGILEEKNVTGFRGIYTASLGKALANFGGMVAGNEELIDYLRYACSSLIYSTALPPSILLGIEKTLDIIETEFSAIGEKMWQYKNLVTRQLERLGFPLADGAAPITSVACGGFEQTIRFSKQLYENGILSTPFVPPSVPLGMGRVRLIAGANLREQSVERALNAFERIAEQSS